MAFRYCTCAGNLDAINNNSNPVGPIARQVALVSLEWNAFVSFEIDLDVNQYGHKYSLTY